MKVDIPWNAHQISSGKIDMHVATPYGVSNHLIVPILIAPTPPPPVAGYSLNETAFQISYCWKNELCKDKLVLASTIPQLKVNWNEATGNIVRDAKIKFAFDPPKFAVEFDIHLGANDKDFAIDGTVLANGIISELNRLGNFNANNPPDKITQSSRPKKSPSHRW